MRNIKILFFICLILLTGCEGSPLAISMMSPEELKSVPDEQLCHAYAGCKNAKLKAELESRELFTPQEWNIINKHDFHIGMSKKALFASRPNLYLTGVSSIRDYGMCEIYSEFATTVSVYIYVQNDQAVAVRMY